jgi:hypothetical protein
MLPRDRAEKILTLGKAGWSVRAIADQLGHSEPTIRGYLSGRTTPGVRAPRPSLLTDPLAGYCRQRFAEDPHLRPSTLFKELTELGFQASRSTFYRELTQGRLSPPGHRPSPAQEDPPQILAGVSRAPVEHPGFGGDSILPRCSGLGGRCLPRYRRLAEPRSDHFPLLFYRTSVQLRCPAVPTDGGLRPPGRPLGGGASPRRAPVLRCGFPGLVKGDASASSPATPEAPLSTPGMGDRLGVKVPWRKRWC